MVCSEVCATIHTSGEYFSDRRVNLTWFLPVSERSLLLSVQCLHQIWFAVWRAQFTGQFHLSQQFALPIPHHRKPKTNYESPGFLPRCLLSSADQQFIPGPQSPHSHGPVWHQPLWHTIWTKPNGFVAPPPKMRRFSQPPACKLPCWAPACLQNKNIRSCCSCKKDGKIATEKIERKGRI